VSEHNNLKTIADVCFLLGSYVDSTKISEESARHDHKVKVIFSDKSRSLGKVMSYSIADSEMHL